jgi:hypothetical protein
MRTEADLRRAFHALADTAPDATAVAGRLQLETSPRSGPRSRPRALVLVAAAVVVVIAAAVLIPFLVTRGVEPADLRRPGYWGFVSQLDPPTGWRIETHGIEREREYYLLRPTADETTSCAVYVFGRGAFRSLPPQGTPTLVGDRPAIYVEATAVEPAQLLWTYADDAWATASCTHDSAESGRQDLNLLAAAVRFEPTRALLPVRLSELPEGYRVSAVLDARVNSAPTGVLGVAAPDLPSFSVFNTADRLPQPAGPGLPGVEELVINGHPVYVREDQRTVQISIGDRFMNITSTGGSGGRQSWEPGERQAILKLAAALRFADDVADPGTWFDAERTLPD